MDIEGGDLLNPAFRKICVAIEALSSAQLLRISAFAKQHVRSLVRKAAGRDHEDLLSEAVTRTLAGQCEWRPRMSFENHLLNAIRQVALDWSLESEREQSAESEHIRRCVPVQSPDRSLEAKELLETIHALFADDMAARNVIDLISQGCTPEEVSAVLEISELDYRAVIARIRQRLERDLPDAESRLMQLVLA